LGDIARFCDQLIWLDRGKIRYSGDVTTGIAMYEQELAPQRSIDLADRTDRIGTGLVRLTRVQILDDKKAPTTSVRTGHDMYLALGYRFEQGKYRQVKDVVVNAVVENEKRQRLFGLPSEVLATELNELAPEGIMTCHIRRLPLVHGTYFLTASLLVDRQLVDKIVDVARLTVLEGNFYGTNKLPLRSYGEVCVDFSWLK